MTESCPTSYLLTSPVAQQCCFANNTGDLRTEFIRSSDGAGIDRNKDPYGGGCQSSTGGSCIETSATRSTDSGDAISESP